MCAVLCCAAGLVITNGLLALAVNDCIQVLECALRHCDGHVDPIYKLVASVRPQVCADALYARSALK
jgi:hypothetical protein